MRIDGKASRDYKKVQRADSVRKIVVEVTREDGTVLPFDGDEEAQQRLDRFSRRAIANGRATLPWGMADNSVMEVTPEEMIEALDLAMESQGQAWFIK